MASGRILIEEVMIGTANLFAMRSTCSRLNVGAVIARNGRILSTGYNGPPSGLAHCDDLCAAENLQGCQRSIHAEVNAIAFAAKNGIAIDDAEIFCTHQPCLSCAQLIINSGIKIVWFEHTYRLEAGIQLLQEAGVTCWMISNPIKSHVSS